MIYESLKQLCNLFQNESEKKVDSLFLNVKAFQFILIFFFLSK